MSKLVASEAGIEGRDFELALDNLFRLRLIFSKATHGNLVQETVSLTTLGYELMRACRPPEPLGEPPPAATT